MEVGESLPSPSVSGAHRAEDKVELLCQTQGAVYVLVTVMLQVTPWPLCSFSCRAGLGRAGWWYPGQSTLPEDAVPACSQPPQRSAVTKWLVTSCSFIT